MDAVIRLIAAVTLSLLMAAESAAAESPCAELEQPRLRSICHAYMVNGCHLANTETNRPQCDALASAYRRAGLGEVFDLFDGGVTATITTQGGTLRVGDMAEVAFAAGDFSSPTVVKVKAAPDPLVTSLYETDQYILGAAAKLAYDVSIEIGSVLPTSATILVSMKMPQALLDAQVPGYQVDFAAVVRSESDLDQSDGLAHLGLAVEGDPGWLEMEVPTGVFILESDNRFRARLTLVASRGENRGTMALAAATSCESLFFPLGGNYSIGRGVTWLAAAPKPHKGIDYPAVKGTPVITVADGTVVFAGENPTSGYGKQIDIQHGTGVSRYAHLDTIEVQKGMQLFGPVRIGTVDDSGRSQGNHLHFEYYPQGGDKLWGDPNRCYVLAGRWTGQYSWSCFSAGGPLTGTASMAAEFRFAGARVYSGTISYLGDTKQISSFGLGDSPDGGRGFVFEVQSGAVTIHNTFRGLITNNSSISGTTTNGDSDGSPDDDSTFGCSTFDGGDAGVFNLTKQ